MKLTRCLLVFILTLTWTCRSAQWFVATNATVGGNGSNSQPWQLQIALTNKAITAGDTVWVHGGTYTGPFSVCLAGTANQPVTLRNYNGERAILDVNGGMFNMGGGSILCSNLMVWGLEFIDSKKASDPIPWGTIGGGGDGTGNWIINCLIHDCCIGIGRGPNAYGNIMWNCGHDNNQEHAMYLQNPGPNPLVVEDNLIGYASGFGIHCYGSVGPMTSFRLIANSVAGCGIPDAKCQLLVGGGQAIIDLVMSNNNCCSPLGGSAIQIGGEGALFSSNGVVEGNYAYAKEAFLLGDYFNGTFICLSNLFSSPYYMCLSATLTNLTFPGQWDYNNYLKQQPYGGYFGYYCPGGVGVALYPTNWVSSLGFDQHSTFALANPPDRVILRPNLYEPKRAHITVWNWSGMLSTNVDVSSVLAPGDNYQLLNAMNYFGGPVASGTYSGGGITCPLTNLSVSPFLYWTPPTTNIYNISTNFAVFVLIGSKANTQLLPPTDVHVISAH